MKGRPSLQYHLITELVCYNDFPTAARYSKYYQLESNQLPPSLNEYIKKMDSEPSRPLYPQCTAILAKNVQKQINDVLYVPIGKRKRREESFKVAQKLAQSPCTIVHGPRPNFGKNDKERILHFYNFI